MDAVQIIILTSIVDVILGDIIFGKVVYAIPT
jgi:hypothetical protein